MTGRSRKRRGVSIPIDDTDLSLFAAIVGGQQPIECFRCAQALRQQFQSTRAKRRVGVGLCGDGSRVGRRPRHHRAHRQKLALRCHAPFFGKPAPESLVQIDQKIARELQRIAKRAQQYHGAITGEYDAATREAVEGLIGIENLEDRWPFGSDQVDPVALRFLKKAYPAKKPRRTTAVKKTARKK